MCQQVRLLAQAGGRRIVAEVMETPAAPEPDLASGTVVAVFVAEWCPVSSSALAAWPDGVAVDVDLWPHLAEQCSVSVLPTVIGFDAGVETFRRTGVSVLRG